LLVLPKFGNVAAGCLVLGLLLFRWLPEAIRERRSAEQHTQYLQLLATTDSLTGLRNRGDFMAVAEAEWQLYQEDRRTLSLLIIDVDFFKSVNDRYGHHIGDQVIMMVARLCRTRKRETDIAGRLGGEEFAILLRNSDLTMAHSFAERLRDLVASEAVAIGEAQLSVTVSVGVSSAVQAQSITDFFKKADSALYEAKRSGRNRVCIFGQPGQAA
jgi:diguanylate cyclase (GGDEF)-like protein